MSLGGTYYVKNYGNVCDYVQDVSGSVRVEDTVPAGSYLREKIDILKTKECGRTKYKIHFCTPMGVQLCRTIDFEVEKPFKDFTLDGRQCESVVHKMWKGSLFHVQEVLNSDQILYSLYEGCGDSLAITLGSMSFATAQFYVKRPDVGDLQFCSCGFSGSG